MVVSNIKSPGVYINEINGFPNSIVSVATAVPAFIGYTPQAAYEGRSYFNVAQKITSFAEFQAIYCIPDLPAPASPTKQYNPEYYLVQQTRKPLDKNYMLINGAYYSILPDPNTIYYLYNSIRHFYQNGGGDAYIVSIGTYGPSSKNPINPGDQIINPNVQLIDLLKGLSLLLNEQEPTMYICPEATLLSIVDNSTLMEGMLLQCETMQTAVAIFDIIGGRNSDPTMYTQDIVNFRTNTGVHSLKYGTAYYPFIGTTTMQMQDIDYTNLFGGDIKQLALLINPATNPNQVLTSILGNIQTHLSTPSSITQNNNALLNASPLYAQIVNTILADVNILPPSGAMAGVITTIDNSEGVWKAPANTSIVGAVSLPINLSESQQMNLNVDAVSGKSINAIRSFNGIGILVWGARTLDGNSQDWQYLSVRRTITCLEQSCKLAIQTYACQPNNKNTWEEVKAVIANFLISIWKQGGLQGAVAADAFSVNCGLGSTMTSDDIFNGFMNITVKVAVIRPAEFIILTFQQQLAVPS